MSDDLKDEYYRKAIEKMEKDEQEKKDSAVFFRWFFALLFIVPFVFFLLAAMIGSFVTP